MHVFLTHGPSTRSWFPIPSFHSLALHTSYLQVFFVVCVRIISVLVLIHEVEELFVRWCVPDDGRGLRLWIDLRDAMMQTFLAVKKEGKREGT